MRTHVVWSARYLALALMWMAGCTQAPDTALLATGHTTLASTDLEGRPIRMPSEFRALLEPVVEPLPAHAGKDSTLPAVQGRDA